MEIQELIEAGSDGGGMLGNYCKGHVNMYNFADACNVENGCEHNTYDTRYVHSGIVRHEYWRTVQVADDEAGVYEFRKSKKGRGAWKVTVASPIQDSLARECKRHNETKEINFSMGKRAGAWSGLEFVYECYGEKAAQAYREHVNFHNGEMSNICKYSMDAYIRFSKNEAAKK